MIYKKLFITRIILSLIVICSLQFFVEHTYSLEPDEILQDKRLELRARKISKNIRCLVCQNQSIDESNSSLAKDLRVLIRNQITNGKKDAEIYKFLRERYGDFILLKTPITKETFLLWFLPFIFLIIGIYIIIYHNKKSKKI